MSDTNDAEEVPSRETLDKAAILLDLRIREKTSALTRDIVARRVSAINRERRKDELSRLRVSVRKLRASALVAPPRRVEPVHVTLIVDGVELEASSLNERLSAMASSFAKESVELRHFVRLRCGIDANTYSKVVTTALTAIDTAEKKLDEERKHCTVLSDETANIDAIRDCVNALERSTDEYLKVNTKVRRVITLACVRVVDDEKTSAVVASDVEDSLPIMTAFVDGIAALGTRTINSTVVRVQEAFWTAATEAPALHKERATTSYARVNDYVAPNRRRIDEGEAATLALSARHKLIDIADAAVQARERVDADDLVQQADSVVSVVENAQPDASDASVVAAAMTENKKIRASTRSRKPIERFKPQ